MAQMSQQQKFPWWKRLKTRLRWYATQSDVQQRIDRMAKRADIPPEDLWSFRTNQLKQFWESDRSDSSYDADGDGGDGE